MNPTKESSANSIIGKWRLGTLWAGASLLALLSATSAQATQILPTVPIHIHVTETITPTAPSFGDSTFTGDSIFKTGHFTTGGFVPDVSFGSASYSSTPWSSSNPLFFAVPGPPQIIPGNPVIVWEFGGTLTNTAGQPIPTYAFVPTPPNILPSPPQIRPLITVASNLLPGFAPFDVSGPIYAFDDPEQVGTWDIHISEASAVPEPATMLLLGLGLAGLAGVKRKLS